MKQPADHFHPNKFHITSDKRGQCLWLTKWKRLHITIPGGHYDILFTWWLWMPLRTRCSLSGSPQTHSTFPLPHSFFFFHKKQDKHWLLRGFCKSWFHCHFTLQRKAFKLRSESRWIKQISLRTWNNSNNFCEMAFYGININHRPTKQP